MAYALQSMLKIRSMREDRAKTELAGARALREQAARVLEERRAQTQAWEETKDSRRDAVFATVMGRSVKMDDLDMVRATVSHIDDEGLTLAKAETAAADDLKKNDELVESARRVWAESAKELGKVEEHRKIWAEEDRKEREKLADAEMEEFTGKKMTADDGESDN